MKIYILVFLAAIALISCNKNEEIPSNLKSGNNDPAAIDSSNIGTIHNDGLDYIMANYSTPETHIDSVFNHINDLQKEYFTNEGYATVNLSDEIKDLLISRDGEEWINSLNSANKIDYSSNLQAFLIDIVNYVYDGENDSFTRSELYTYLDNQFSAASIVLSANELEIFGEHISVGKSSFDYWFASDGTPRNVYNNSSRGPINYWQTLGADIIGGIFGGPGGYLGVSALDIYYQAVIK